jgi:PilZ domain
MTQLLPRIGDEIMLAVPLREKVLARIAGDGPGFFDLNLLEMPVTPQRQLERSGLMIEFINDEGVARMHGRLDVPGYTRGHADPRAVRFAHRGVPQLLQRREYIRATVTLPLTLIPLGTDDPVAAAHAQALDLSGGGMQLRGLDGAVVDAAYRFTLDLGDGAPPVEGACRIVRLDGADRAGVQFTELAEPDRVRVVHAAFEMSREQRRRMA